MIFDGLALPLMCAPMSFASSVALATASCQAGVIGGWQGGTYTSIEEFSHYLDALNAPASAPPIVNLPARIADLPEGEEKLKLLAEHRVPLVLSSVGDPGRLVDVVHQWGGRIIQDVTTMRHAEKALAAGVDGLMLTCAGAGGHSGNLTPMSFVPAIRRHWAGLLIVAGGIADARGIAGALALGADIACMGTRFIATPESGVVQGHRDMIVAAGMDRIISLSAMNGVPANWIRDSVEAAGLDPATLPDHRTPMPDGVKPWRDIFSAGHSVGLIGDQMPVADLVSGLTADFVALGGHSGWRERLHNIERSWV